MPKKYRALTDLSLWKTAGKMPDPFDDPKQWWTAKAGEEFTPPGHMNIKKALERGIVEEVA
jgi:hypothetical protein